MDDNQVQRTCEVCGKTYTATRRPTGAAGEWYNWFLCSEGCCAVRREEVRRSKGIAGDEDYGL